MRAVSITNRGGRKNNEDSVRYANVGDLWCFVVCDGLGGQCCGEVASQLVAEEVCNSFKQNPKLSADSLYSYLESAVKLLGIERERDENKFNMSTTIVALVTDGKEAVWASCGDSRLYYISNSEIIRITDDHSVAFSEFQRGMITYDEIRKSPNQNRLLKCMNSIEYFDPDISKVQKLKESDSFLLCSDGFWEFVNESDIESTRKKSVSPKQWLQSMLEILHKNEIEKNDNYSAVVVIV